MSFNLDLWWKRSAAPACLLLCLLAAIVRPQTAGGKPVKLAIQTPSYAVIAGARVELEIVLQNTNNQAVKAPKDFPLELEVRQPSGKPEKKSVTIRTGGTATKFPIQLNEPGLVKIYARHRELLEGSAFINVRSSQLKPGSRPTPRPRMAAFYDAPPPVATGAGFGFDQVRPVLQLASLVIPQEEAPPFPAAAEASPKPRLTLDCSSQRRILADGKDEARIQLFLEETLTAGLRVHLASSGGKLTPEVVVIPPDKDYGEARLTNNQSGPVTVSLRNSTPKVELNGDKELKLSFAPPITKLDLEVSPPKIYQCDRSDLIVRLKDEHDRPVKTDEAREISLTIESGSGEVKPKNFAIQPGQFEGRANFTPASSGKVVVAAWTESLAADRDELQIDRATILLIWAGVGGLLGGLLAFWSRRLRWWRLPTGAITGQVFYWGFTFGALPLLPPVAVANSWSAFAISVIGGWLGTEVFSLILRRFGLLPAKVEAEDEPDAVA
jgi:hypothetical protein